MKKPGLYLAVLVVLVVLPMFLVGLTRPTYAALSFAELGSVVDSGAPVAGSNFGLGIQKGDINGDGYDDLAVAAGGYLGIGRLYVFYSGATLDTTADVIISGPGFPFPNGQWSNLTVADVDGDGYADLLAGYASGNGAGYVFFGSNSMPSALTVSEADVTVNGDPTIIKGLGSSATTGDVNGDGYLDLIFGCYQAGGGLGSVAVYYGNGTKLTDTTVDKILTVAGSTMLGFSALVAGDVNGDGFADVFTDEVYTHGEAYLFYGGADMDITYDVKFNQEAANDYLSQSAVDIRDINGDDYADVCMGANKNDGNGAEAGRLYCFWGSASLSGTKSVGTDANVIISGAVAGDYFARHLSICDVNNDGHEDLVVGAIQPYTSSNGYVKIYLGDGTSTFNTVADSTVTITPTGNWFGAWIGAGDMDSDGWPDLLLAARKGGNGTGDTGRVYVFEVIHGTPSVSVASSAATNDTTPSISGTALDSSGVHTIAGVQWSADDDPSGTWYECSANDGVFNSANEGFACSVTTILSVGLHDIFFRSYDENQVYLPSVSYGHQLLTVDLVAPGKVVITNIGLIDDVPNKDRLYYYFTSETPRIKGTAEAGGTVYFADGDNIWSSTVNSSGRFELEIDSPELDRGRNDLTHYVKDQAGNQSTSRTLILVIGEEYFPDWLIGLPEEEQGEEQSENQEEIEEEIEDNFPEEEGEEQEQVETGEEPVTGFPWWGYLLMILGIFALFVFLLALLRRKSEA